MAGLLTTPWIFADWGNSSGRLFLMHGETAMDSARIIGAKHCTDFAGVFEKATSDWDAQNVLLCGAVTSNIGWVNTGYCAAGAPLSDWAAARETVREGGRTLHFLPGLKTPANRHGYFDTMRGEDMQLFGYQQTAPDSRAVILMPGTHSKWVSLQGGAWDGLLTGLSGELFEVLSAHSILTDGRAPSGEVSPAFLRGAAMMQSDAKPSLSHALMAVRTLQISGELSAQDAPDFLSGLIVSEDCREALRVFGGRDYVVIGGKMIAELYAYVLREMGQSVSLADDTACTLRGLCAVRALIEA